VSKPVEAAPPPVDEPIVCVVQGQTVVIQPDTEAWPVAYEWRELKVAAELLEQDLRTKRAQIKRLQADADLDRRTCAERPAIDKLFALWQEQCKHPRSKLTAERFDAARVLLQKGYTAEDLTLAIEGAAYDPFTKVRKNGSLEAFNDFELIMRDGTHVERFANRAPMKEKQLGLPES
jgi:hypothetical protein